MWQICGNLVTVPCRISKPETLFVLTVTLSSSLSLSVPLLGEIHYPSSGKEWDNLLLIRLTFHLLLPSMSGIFLHRVKHCSFTAINSCLFGEDLVPKGFSWLPWLPEGGRKDSKGSTLGIALLLFNSIWFSFAWSPPNPFPGPTREGGIIVLSCFIDRDAKELSSLYLWLARRWSWDGSH